LESGSERSIFVDDNPTNYVDIGITKDKKFLVVSSNTKEDSEIWVRERGITDEVLPRKLVPRVKDVKAHIDHLRDFFVVITTLGSKNKNFRIAT
jgi:protease II